eukprot:COSAG06_NODE_39339_length_413_cov_7.837580_1_plen_28_part_01
MVRNGTGGSTSSQAFMQLAGNAGSERHE